MIAAAELRSPLLSQLALPLIVQRLHCCICFSCSPMLPGSSHLPCMLLLLAPARCFLLAVRRALAAVIWFSFMPPKSFSSAARDSGKLSGDLPGHQLHLLPVVAGTAFVTVALLALICYPVAYGLVRVFGKWATLITLLFTIPLFVSENIRLYGWVLFLIKNGVLLGSLKSIFGLQLESMLFTIPAIILGMVYVYLPFMLFPMTLGISMVPSETRDAAFDLGASRWQVFKEVELPLSMPGVVIGFPPDLRARGGRHRRGQGAGRAERHPHHP